MSGPKSGSYRVISEAERARREQERARNLAAVARWEFEAAVEAARIDIRSTRGLRFELPAQPRWPGDRAAAADYHAYSNSLAELLERMRQEQARAHQARRTALVAKGLKSSRTYKVMTADEVLGDPPPVDEPVVTPAEHVSRLLARLRDDITPADRSAVETRAQRLEQAEGHDEVRRRLDELRRRVDVANKRAAQLDEDVVRARYLLADLRSTPDPPSDLDAALLAVIARETTLDERLVARVGALVAAAEATADAAYVSATVAEVLEELGYDVGIGFRTALTRDGLAHVRRQGQAWADHGVRIRLDRDRGMLTFHVVGASDRPADAGRDTALEEELCEDVPRLVEGLGERGVSAPIRSSMGAGQVPVAEVPREVLGQPLESPNERGRRRKQQRRAKERRA